MNDLLMGLMLWLLVGYSGALLLCLFVVCCFLCNISNCQSYAHITSFYVAANYYLFYNIYIMIAYFIMQLLECSFLCCSPVCSSPIIWEDQKIHGKIQSLVV